MATWGYDQNAIAASIEAFVQRFEAGGCSLRWRSDGLRALDRHIAEGDRVLVVTAAPVWLAERLLVSRAEVRVLGSTLARRWGGWFLEHHCHRRGEVSNTGTARVWHCLGLCLHR